MWPTLHTRIWAPAAFALGIAGCATGGEDDGADLDSGITITDDDAAADAGTDVGPGGYDSSLLQDGSSTDSASADEGFPPPGDASPDATPPDASSPDTSSGGPCSFTGTIATFTLTGQTGDEASVAGTTSATGVTVGALTRSSALTAVSGTGSINSSGWALTANAGATKYYTFTVTPPTGCALTLTTMALDVKASATGPELGDVATSTDTFATHTASFAATSTTNVTFSSVSGTAPIEVRIYGYEGLSASGTYRILTTLTVSGSTS
jgi:hypothetical protein